MKTKKENPYKTAHQVIKQREIFWGIIIHSHLLNITHLN